MIYYDTIENKIQYVNYEKLNQIFCENCDVFAECSKNFDRFMEDGFIVEESYNKKMSKYVTKYYISDLHKMQISNKHFIDKNIISKIVRNDRYKKLEKLND